MAVVFQGLPHSCSLFPVACSVVSAFVCLAIHIRERFLHSPSLQLSLPASEMHFDICCIVGVSSIVTSWIVSECSCIYMCLHILPVHVVVHLKCKKKMHPFGVGTSVHVLGCDRSMAVLVGVFRGQLPVLGPLLLVSLSKPRRTCSLCWVLQEFKVYTVGIQWLLLRSSKYSVTPNSRMMEVLSIPALHSDSLSWELGLLSGGGVMDATGIKPSCTQ